MKEISKELIGASASSIILSLLQQGDSYGYEIIQRVKEYTDGKIKWKEASIYPVLKKMEGEGMIKSYWKMEDGERPRKYYSILVSGIKQLEANKVEWNMVQSIFTRLWSIN
jgi:DNA-binding PadR family transcriptional regulator